MKLRNKLLPIIGLSAVCATAIPLASCSQTSKAVNLLERYYPAEKLEYKEFEEMKKAENAYFSATNFASHFSNDYYWSTSLYNYKINNGALVSAYSEGDYIIDKASGLYIPVSLFGITFDLPIDKILFKTTISKDTEKLSDVSFRAKTLKMLDGLGEEFSRRVFHVSYKLEYELDMDTTFTFLSTSEKLDVCRKVKGTLEVHDLPMMLSYDVYETQGVKQFYIQPDTQAIVDRMRYVEYNELPEAQYIICNAVQKLEGSSSVTMTTGETKDYKIDDYQVIGFKEDGSLYQGEEEGREVFEQFFYDTLTTANKFASYYLFSCSLEGEQE